MSCCCVEAVTYLYDRYWPQIDVAIPDSLEHLVNVDKLFIDEKHEGPDVFTRKYCHFHCAIVDMNGQHFYSINHECDGEGRERSFRSSSINSKLKVYDANGKEVLMLEKPDYLNHNEVYIFLGKFKLGLIRKHDYFSHLTKLSIFNSRRKRVFVITIIPSDDVNEYQISSVKGQSKKIGEIKKKFSDSTRDYCVNPDKYGVMFLPELDVKEKAMLMAATILLDCNYFEN